jgi:hypothetical protein
MGEIRHILKNFFFFFFFKGYTCRFKSEAFTSIALRPCYGDEYSTQPYVIEFVSKVTRFFRVIKIFPRAQSVYSYFI